MKLKTTECILIWLRRIFCVLAYLAGTSAVLALVYGVVFVAFNGIESHPQLSLAWNHFGNSIFAVGIAGVLTLLFDNMLQACRKVRQRRKATIS